MSDRFLREKMIFGDDAMERLKNAHVAVFGIGGVGSWCAEALARAGVSRLTLIDEDTVSETNTNRQIVALSSTVGLPKAEVMARRIADISPESEVRALPLRYEASTRERFFDVRYDFIADAIDLVSCKVDLIATAHGEGIPMISALGTGNKLDASRLKISDISKTSGCPLARVVRRELRARGITHHTVVFSDELPAETQQLESPPPGRRSVPGSVVWVPASAGLLIAQHIVTELVK